MITCSDPKVLYIVVNAGFADDIVDIIHEAGAGGATIINARGIGSMHKCIMGIMVDSEKEIVFSLATEETAYKIAEMVKDKAGVNTPASGISYIMPVDRVIG